MTWSITADDSPEMGMSADEVEIPFTLANAINLGEGTSDHAALYNLDYANSGHTGFQAAISDLETIRSGAAAGATALQSVPSTYRTSAAQDVIDATKQTADFVVTTSKEDEGYVADKTNAQIYAASQAGKRIFLHMGYEDQWYLASEVTATKAKFGFVEDDGQEGVNASVVTMEDNVVTADLWGVVTDTELANYRTAAAQNLIDAGKQDSLTAAQLAAANSGITAAKVAAAKVYTYIEDDGFITITAEEL